MKNKIVVSNVDMEKYGAVFEIGISVTSIVRDILKIANENIPSHIKVTALIDTGAGISAVDKKIIDELNLYPHDYEYIFTPFDGVRRYRKYDASFKFTNNVAIETSVIPMNEYNSYIKCYIGRDVLKMCKFVYNGKKNIFSIDF